MPTPPDWLYDLALEPAPSLLEGEPTSQRGAFPVLCPYQEETSLPWQTLSEPVLLVVDPLKPKDADPVLSPVAASFLAFGLALGVPLPRSLRARPGYNPPQEGDCPRCAGTRRATRDGMGRPVPAHACPVCRQRPT